MGNTAKQCRLGLFEDSDFAGDLEDSKSSSGGTLCVFGSHTFVPTSWMCKKQTSVSHRFNRIRNHLFRCWIEIRRHHPHLIYGIWLFQFLETRLRTMIERWDPLWTQVKFVLHLTRFTNASNLEEWSMIWIMLILFPQTSNLLVRKLCWMCLKTTKQWSRWS